MKPPVPPNEQKRLARLNSYAVLDTPPEEEFDRIVRLAVSFFGVPIALITLIDADRQYFKSCYGLNISETSRDVSFCAHAILHEDVMVVPDATQDARFADNPLVRGEPHIRFYAGAPLMTPDGFSLGTLCLIDTEPRTFSDAQREDLSDLAALVVAELELRREVAQRKQVEQALRASYEETRNILESITDAFFALDGDWCFTYINQEAERMLGDHRANLIGQNLWDSFPSMADSRLNHEYHRAVRDQTDVDFELYFAPHKRWYHVKAYPYKSGLSVYFTDVTQQKASEAMREETLQRQEELVEMKSRFISTTSHEFKTPLATILLSTQLARRLYPFDTARAEKHLRRIEANVEEMTQMIEDILTLSRSEADEVPFKPKPLDIRGFITEVIDDVLTSRDTQPTINLNLPDDPVWLNTDPKHLRLMIGNLISNAIKYTPSVAPISVDLAATPDRVDIAIRDQGIGIPATDLNQIFEPFYRANNVGSVQGTGLGLAIVKRAVDLHGGNIDVESRPGAGTTFRLRLPLQPPPSVLIS